MILRVNPNRMELLRLRKRLVLAQRGHKLLQDKLEEMMRRFLEIIKDIDRAKEDFSVRTKRVTADLLYCRITGSKANFEKALANIYHDVKIGVSARRILNVEVPVFDIEELKIEKRYDFYTTSAQMDIAVLGAEDYVRSLLRLAGLLKGLEVLSFEIERTRRRVNALEYMLIPTIRDTIHYITQKLNEFERSNLTRLMRVKELIEAGK